MAVHWGGKGPGHASRWPKAASTEYAFSDTDAASYVAAMTEAPDNSRKAKIDTLFTAMKASGVWAKVGWLSILWANTSQSAKLNAKNPALSLVATGSPTFTVYGGITGDSGGTSFLSTPGNIGAYGYTQNSGHIGVWVNQQGASSGVKSLAKTSNNLARLTASSSDTGVELQMNDYTLSNIGAQPSPGRVGHWIGTRTGASARAAYLDGVLIGSSATTSTTLPASPFSPCHYVDDRHSVAHCGGALNATDVANLYSAFSALMAP